MMAGEGSKGSGGEGQGSKRNGSMHEGACILWASWVSWGQEGLVDRAVGRPQRVVDRAVRYSAMKFQWVGGNRVMRLQQIGRQPNLNLKGA